MTIKVSREWLGETVPTALEMVMRGLDNPVWYANTFGLTPRKGLENIIGSIRTEARNKVGQRKNKRGAPEPAPIPPAPE